MNIKSALRDLLSVPYGMISILQRKTIQPRLRSEISLFFLGRSPVVKFYHKRAPSINVRRPQQPSAAEPLSNLRTLGAIAPSNFRTLKPHRGLSIRRLYGFRRQRRHLYWRPQGRRTSPAQRYYITTLGGALNPPVRRSRSQAEPWQPRARGPAAASTLTPVRACQPTGILESTAMAASRPYFLRSAKVTWC